MANTTNRAKSRTRRKQRVAEDKSKAARNVFLAGLGAYGLAREEAQSQLEENRARVEELFSELVKRGEQVETTARRKIEELELPQLKLAGREELSARLDKARTSFDTLREALSLKSA
jgi:hypothetical protein